VADPNGEYDEITNRDHTEKMSLAIPSAGIA
jgi:hypothetical protein